MRGACMEERSNTSSTDAEGGTPLWRRAAENVQLLASLSSGARKWFFACLLTVVLLEASPWLYYRFTTTLSSSYQRSGSTLQLSDPSDMIYNPFDPTDFSYEQAEEIFKCTINGRSHAPRPSESPAKTCPSYFRFIKEDLAPWNKTGITQEMIERAKKPAGFRVVILSGSLYIDRYYKCFLTRAVYTVWGLLLLLEKFKGQVPDVEFVFNCEDRPRIPKAANGGDGPPVLFAYDSNSHHFDIPFPDWSFWGWSELLISPWDDKRETIIRGAKNVAWKKKTPMAYWSGNAYSGAPHRVQLLSCHHAKLSEIRGQDWSKELRTGKKNSKLEDQCSYRHMIYTEGNGWSVSFKYIMACGSPTLVIAPSMYDFFSRGLRQWVHYIPIRPSTLAAPEMCAALDKAVEFGEANQTEVQKIGKAGQDFMRNEIGMENVYNYMFHLLTEYSQLMKFQPVLGDARLVTLDHVLCLHAKNEVDKRTLQESMNLMPSNRVPCQLSEIPETGLEEADWETKWGA